MKIAFTGARGVPALYSGFETALSEIGPRLVERGHEVTVYCRNGYGDASEPYYRGVKKVYLPRLEVKVADTLSHTLASFLHSAVFRPDVLIVVNPANGPLCLIPRAAGIPFAVNVDGLEWKRAKWPWIGQRYFYFASWATTKIAPRIIADSRGIQDFYAQRWNTESWYAAYGAYEEKSTRPELLREFEVEPGEYFLVVARLEPENHPHLFVEAYPRLQTDKKLIVVGGTNFRSRYVEAMQAKNRDPRVRFVGGVYEQDKLTELMCNAYAYLHGHSVGGTNPVLLKALGCGAPVLYADVSFNREVAGDAGVGFPIDVDGVTDGLRRALAEPELLRRLSANGPRRIREAFTWDMVTDRYEALCYELVGRRAGAAAPDAA